MDEYARSEVLVTGDFNASIGSSFHVMWENFANEPDLLIADELMLPE